jgi:hypothetical protein
LKKIIIPVVIIIFALGICIHTDFDFKYFFHWYKSPLAVFTIIVGLLLSSGAFGMRDIRTVLKNYFRKDILFEKERRMGQLLFRIYSHNFIACGCIVVLICCASIFHDPGGRKDLFFNKLIVLAIPLLYGVLLGWVICVPMANRFESIPNQGSLEHLDYLESGERFALWMSLALIGLSIVLPMI